jgi:hypothetical protein
MKKLFAIFVFLTTAFAQQFTTPPILKPTLFECDEVKVLFADRDSDCLIKVYYAADKNVGIERIYLQLLSIRDMYGDIVKETEGEFEWTKAKGNLIPFGIGSVNKNKQAEYTIPLEFSVKVENCYQVGVLFGSVRQCRAATAKELKAKFTFYFANGIQYKNEISIRVK